MQTQKNSKAEVVGDKVSRTHASTAYRLLKRIVTSGASRSGIACAIAKLEEKKIK